MSAPDLAADYRATLDSLYARLPVYHRTGPAAYNKDLGKTRQLLTALGEPHTRFRSLHIAGTNGKGSVSATLAAVYTAAGPEAGYGKVGLFTSPHLIDFTERIRVNGEPVPQEWVVQWVAQHEALIAELNPTFFELNVAMAFAYFAEVGVDLAVVEVGLGGRLDSTNVITPHVTAVTSIGYDHMDLLGDTLTLIATEKAGIFKPGVPAVIGAVPDEARVALEAVATQVEAPLVRADHRFRITPLGTDGVGRRLQIDQLDKPGSQSRTLSLSLLGDYQRANLATALAVLEAAAERGLPVPAAAVEQGLANVQALTGLRGRFERLREAPLVIADVAHNADGIAAVLAQIARLQAERPGGDLHIVLGASADKDLRAVIRLLPQHATYYYVKADIPRGLPGPDLQALGEEVQLIGAYYPSVATGVQAALAFAEAGDVVLITGSVFVVGEALAAWR